MLEGENVGENATNRDARRLAITDDVFQAYIERHRLDPVVASVIVPESNEQMRDSYLILDERMRFLNCTAGGKIPGRSLLEAGVHGALQDAGHDESMFYARGGAYEW